ncbi:MAG: acyl-CoA dehydrogenase family protein [Actinobacteria bacterium]|nr:acyl-CoA dehydrogenase family protein [Actinomycetota bacterium]
MADITEEQFTQEVTAFLESNSKLRADKPAKADEQKVVWGEGEDDIGLFEDVDRAEEQVELAKAKAWRGKRAAAGLAWITGPKAYGGRELPATYDRIYASLEAKYETPDMGFFGIGLGMVAPTLLAHGTDHAKDLYLQKMHSGEIVGCQLFSEPGAGSDLASLQCKAERDGDEWVLNGQKVWTSGAHYSDIGEIICRTNPDLPKHKGLTGFMVDMKAPGVEVRPLRQMTGGAAFNEVFFTDVRVPDHHRLGDVNEGWGVAITTLMNERASIGGGMGGGMGVANTARLIEMLRHFGLADDLLFRNELANIYINFQVAKYTNQRAADKMKAGATPGPEMSIGKMALTKNLVMVNNFVAKVLGPRLTADTGEWGTYSWGNLLLGTPAMRIAGGSDEVMRNIVGERVLGLPKDPGIDSKTPFRELKVGTQKSS